MTSGRMSEKYLYQINHTYYFRLRIPRDLKRWFPIADFRRSLKTKTFTSAQQLTRLWAGRTEVLFTKLRSGVMTEGQILQLVEDYIRAWLDETDEYRVAFGHQLVDCGTHTEPAIPYTEMIDNTVEDMYNGTYKRVRPYVKDFLSEQGIVIDLDSMEYKRLLRDLSLAHIKALEIDSAREEGVFTDEYYLQSNKNAKLSTPSIPAPAKDCGVSFSELAETYIAEKTIKNEWKGKTETQNIARLKLLSDLLGADTPVKSLTRKDLITCLEGFKKIPSNRNKLIAYKDKTVHELIKINIPEKALLSPSSIKHHMELLSTLFKFGVRSDFLDKNYAEGLAPRITTKAADERQVYDIDDLQKIVNCTYKKETVPSKKFIPTLAMYTGLRLEEACQLYKRDIENVEGVWCINVIASEDQAVKTQAGARRVPVHSKLIELGFLDYVDTVEHERLWPELNKGRDGYSDAYGKWYQRLNRGYITSNTKKVFHSFRHTVVTQLVNNEVQDSTIKEIVGHSKEGVTRDRYAKALPPAITKKAIETLDYGIRF